jgi:hypothetical protein
MTSGMLKARVKNYMEDLQEQIQKYEREEIADKEREIKKNRKNKNTWFRVAIPIIAMFVFTVFVVLERRGISVQVASRFEDLSKIQLTETFEQEKECLVVVDKKGESEEKITSEMLFVLDSLRVGYDVKDVSEVDWENELKNYKTLVLSFQDWDKIGEGAEQLSKWLVSGGRMMNTMTPAPNSVFSLLASKIGVDSFSSYVGIDGLRMDNNALIGADQKNTYKFMLGEETEILTSLGVLLDSKAKRYVSSYDGTVPLIWSNDIEDGRAVIMNYVITDKFQRGFYTLCYSLLEDSFMYPVINGSSFYIDDFPAPVPGGNGEYIERDYGIDTASFYSTVWWPQILNWQKQYGIVYTGLIIEDYNNFVEGELPRNKQTSRFSLFGNTMINNGNELGLHGYNHQPLCVEGIDDDMQFGEYKLWASEEDLKNSIKELVEFSSALYPTEKFQVYVPPSNIMSETGEKLLLEAAPDIKVIASVYLKADGVESMVQEFTVEENGIIDTPRVVSGCMLDEYAKLTAFSEFNFHYVQSHFVHPDDILDEDRGAKSGWPEMSRQFTEYLELVKNAVPDMRNLSGTDMGAATYRYCGLSVERDIKDGEIDVRLGGFSKEAYLLLRINEGEVKNTEGCTVTEVADGLYLVKAVEENIKIYY